MIVADTNLIAYLFIPGDQTESARQVFVRDPVWAAPPLWRSELRNVRLLYVRQGQLTLDDALAVQREAELLLSGREYAVDSAEVLLWATRSGRSAYNCEFATVAENLGVPLVTVTGKCLRVFRRWLSRLLSLHRANRSGTTIAAPLRRL